MTINPEHLKDYCNLSALCRFHPDGEGCVIRHFAESVQSCNEYQKLKGLTDDQRKELEAKKGSQAA